MILYRTFEKYFGKSITTKLFGYYQWEKDARMTYTQYFEKVKDRAAAMESRRAPIPHASPSACASNAAPSNLGTSPQLRRERDVA